MPLDVLNNDLKARLSQWLIEGGGYLLVLLMPTTVFWFFGRSTAPTIFPLLASPALYLSDIALIWLLLTHGRRLRIAIEKRGSVDLIWLVLCLLATITAVTAFSPYYALYTTCRWLLALICYRLLLYVPIVLPRLIAVFIGGLSLQAVVGLMQVLTGERVGLPGESTHFYIDRATGMTFHPNVFAGYLLVGLLLMLPWIGRTRYLPIWWLLWAAWYMTGSRSSALALGVSMPIALLWIVWHQPAMRRNVLIGLIGAGVLIGSLNRVVLTEPHYRFPTATTTFDAQSALEARATTALNRLPEIASQMPGGTLRWQLVAVAFGILTERPLQGIGAGNFPLATIPVFTELNYPYPDNVHNVPLLLAAEIGVLGGGLWLFLMVLGVWWLIRHWQTDNVWLIVGLCAWLALAGESLLEYYPWGLETGRLLTMFVWAIIGRNLHPHTAQPQETA